MSNSSRNVVRICVATVSLTVPGLLLSGCDDGTARDSTATRASLGDASALPSSSDAAHTSIRSLVASEELILQLTPRMRLLNASVLNLGIPDASARPLFANQVSVVDLRAAGADRVDPKVSPLDLQATEWPVGNREQIQSVEELDLWRPLFSQCGLF